MNAASFGFCERALRIEWRKCSIRESRTHCVPKFARKYFDEISLRACAKYFFESSFARRIDPCEVRVKGFERRDDLVARRHLAGGGRCMRPINLSSPKCKIRERTILV
jgi:hypothetical protein